MSLPDLVTLSNADPDAIFTAASRVRDACGWHIAPSVTETVTLDSDGGSVLLLPSLFVTSVDAVTVLGQAVDPASYQWSANGALTGRWPARVRSVVVTFTHGYESCPDGVSQAVRRLAVVGKSLGVRSQTSGPYSVTYEPGSQSGAVDGVVAHMLAPYTRPKRP